MLRANAPGVMAPVLSILNVSMPKIVKALVENLEMHETEGSFEVSFMAKLAVGRIVNFSIHIYGDSIRGTYERCLHQTGAVTSACQLLLGTVYQDIHATSDVSAQAANWCCYRSKPGGAK